MKFKKVIVSFLVSLMLLCQSVTVFADVPYESYTYTKRSTYKAPHAFVPRTVIDGKALGTTPFKAPKGMFVYKDTIYMVDTGNNRIVMIDSAFNLKGTIDGFDNGSVKDTFNLPEDVYVSKNGLIYVADTENKRIVVLNSDTSLNKIITKPNTDLLSEEVQFKPLKLVANGTGSIYSIIQHVNSGIVELDKDGDFKSFYGANKTKYNKYEYIKRLLSNETQMQSAKLNVPTNYNNLYIDNSGFIYSTTDAFELEDYISAIFESGSDSDAVDKNIVAPVRRMNLIGEDVLKRNGYKAPIGDLAISIGSSVSGSSEINDIHVSDEGIISILDKNKCRVFSYDQDSNMLYMFGGKGSSVGNMLTPSSVDKIGKNMIVLDSSMNNITVYSPTKYGESIYDAIQYYAKGQYNKSSEKWNECLTYNATYTLAYEGIAKAAYRSGDYEKAMKYFKIAESKDDYSKAFKEQRKDIAILYFGVFAGMVIACIIAYFIIKNINGRIRRGSRRKARKDDLYV